MNDRGRIGRARRAASAAAALTLLMTAGTGCYSYRPASSTGPVAGENVRVVLTGAGQDRLRERNGMDESRIDGRLVRAEADDVAVELRIPASRLGYGSVDFVDTVSVPRSEVRQLEVKELSTSRSVLAAALGVAALAGTYAAFESGESGEGDENGGGELSLVPLMSWLLSGLTGG